MKRVIHGLPRIRRMSRKSLSVGVLILFFAWAGIRPAYAQGGNIYVVRRGDTLIGIAARHGVTASQLAAANGLRWNSWVYAGQRLKIPGRTAASTAASTGGTYVVRPGDTLIGIAARHGVTASQLAAANRLHQNSWVYVGQRLKIPGQSAAAPASSAASTAAPHSGLSIYIVRPGDTLISIAARHGVTARQLAMANGMYTNSWVYIGQQLKIPGRTSTSATSTTAPRSGLGTYVVRPGDTLIGIAARHGVGVSRLAAVNGLRVNSWVYVGQRLRIPGRTSASQTSSASQTTGTTAVQPSSAAQNVGGTKWIDVNLSTQTLTAYAGRTVVFRARVSTGTWRYPTVVGTFRVYVKYRSARMQGPGYNLPNVPYVMYFYRGYGLHGTYWHNNFGTPMSHGCINLSIPDARWLYNWAPVGTKVVTHY